MTAGQDGWPAGAVPLENARPVSTGSDNEVMAERDFRHRLQVLLETSSPEAAYLAEISEDVAQAGAALAPLLRIRKFGAVGLPAEFFPPLP